MLRQVEGGPCNVMSPELMVAMTIVGIGGIISGLAGFGFGLVTVPILLMVYPPATVTVVASSLSLSNGWLILLSTWRTVQVRTLGALIPGATLGLILGTVLIRTLDSAVIKLIAGLVVILFALSILRGWRIDAIHHPLAAPVAGVFSGTLGTSAGMSGPPVVLLFTTRAYDMQSFRGTITTYFTYVNALGITLLITQGIAGREQLEIALHLLPMAIVGGFVGRRLVNYISQAQFRVITLMMLLVTGSIGTTAALRALIG